MKKLSDKGSFERQWEAAFRDAGKKPPGAVWDKINAELSGLEISGYKKRLLVFKWLAAASVLLAVGLGFYSLYLHDGLSEGVLNSEKSVQQVSVTDDGRSEVPEIDVVGKNKNEVISGDQPSARSDVENLRNNINAPEAQATAVMAPAKKQDETGVNAGRPSQSPVASVIYAKNETLPADSMIPAEDRKEFQKLTSPVPVTPLAFSGQMEKPALPVSFMYKKPVVPVNFKGQTAPQPVQFYAGLNFSTGRFNPNFENTGGTTALMNADLAVYSEANARVTSNMSMNDNPNASGESYHPDISYSYGINMGAKIARRWVVRSGLSYVKANSIANTSAYLQNHSNNERYPILKAANYQSDGVVEIQQTGDIQFENAFEFASVPLKAGYIVLDKKLDLILFGGVSSDFFIKNTIFQKDNLTNVIENTPGTDSPYRNVYFNGSLSTALGYTIAGHYRLALEPGYRMALNSFTKDSFILTGKPDAFYVNFGLSYRFK